VEFLIVMVMLLGVMYVVMIRPQRSRQRQHQTMIDSAGVGEDVLTTGGIYGTVTHAEGDDIVVEIADGVSVHMTRRGIAAVLPPEEEEDEGGVVDAEAEEEIEEEIASEQVEADVTANEEAVTSDVDADTRAADRR
jgi:preprotein translocase subunit YajC